MTQTLNKAETKQRNLSVDLIRIVAFCFVVAVHFFLHIAYYNTPFNNMGMALCTFVRNTAMSCVPLFIILTGYLMSQKKLNKEYYKGIVRTLLIFALAEACCIIYDLSVFEKSAKDIILSIGVDHYSWYIDMYIGLFLIIPFLNLAYNGLQTQKQKQILVLTFFAICLLFANISGIFKQSQGWWKVAYPLAYYFVGCYIREFPPKRKIYQYLLIGISSTILLVGLLYLMNRNRVIKGSVLNDYNSVFIYITSISIFCAILKTQSRLNKSALSKLILPKISRLTLGAYLISYITDDMVYDTLYAYVPNELTQFYYFPLTVLVSIIASLCLSYFINLICDGILCLFKFKKA